MLLTYLGIFYLVVVHVLQYIFLSNYYTCSLVTHIMLYLWYLSFVLPCILVPALYPRTLGLWIVVRMLCKLYYVLSFLWWDVELG